MEGKLDTKEYRNMYSNSQPKQKTDLNEIRGTGYFAANLEMSPLA